MPTTYTHYRFGNEGLKLLSDSQRALVQKYRELYDIGQHGPDIFFYYKAYKSNPVNQFGYQMHKESMASFLKKVKPLYDASHQKKALKAYLLGFTGHFTLDSFCHGYVERKLESCSFVNHDKIESQFDRYLLIKDGLDPIDTKVAFSIHPGHKKAAVIASIFPEWDSDVIYDTIHDQRMYLDLLSFKSPYGKKALELLFHAIRKNKLCNVLMDYNENTYCKDSNLRLEKLFNKALEFYPTLATNTIGFLDNNEPLDSYFDYHFGPKPDYKTIEVLSYEDELHYEA